MSCLKLFTPDVESPESSVPFRLRVVYGDDLHAAEGSEFDPVAEGERDDNICVLRMTPPCPVCREVSLEISPQSDSAWSSNLRSEAFPRLWNPNREDQSDFSARNCRCRRCDHEWTVHPSPQSESTIRLAAHT